MRTNKRPRTVLSLLTVCAGAIGALNAMAAQTVSLNYDRLSSLEEPLAAQVGGVSLLLNGIVDTPVRFGLEDDGNTEEGFIGNFQVSAATQLRNRWHVNLAYFGQYAAASELTVDMNDHFTDNVALSVDGAWGTVLGGNLSGVVREQTRRRRGAGNAFLAFDDTFGRLEHWGGGFLVRLGPWVASTVVDEDANFDLGAMFQRPLGTRDFRFTLRYTEAAYTSADRTAHYNARAMGVVAELVYGGALFDLGAGYERFSATGPDTDQWYLSSGVRYKDNALTWSIGGQYGQVDGEDRTALALGFQYDMARGLSANAGLNHEDARAEFGYVSFIHVKDTNAVMSLRYSS